MDRAPHAITQTTAPRHPEAPQGKPLAKWIWADPQAAAPKNRLTLFRTEFDLEKIPEDSTLRFAANSTGRLWINGHVLRRKVSRFHEEHITAEVVHAGPYLRPGRNVILVLHHCWGDIVTFQRTGCTQAALFVESSFVHSDASWHCRRAPEFLPHIEQITGVTSHPRIRFPQVIDGRQALGDALLEPGLEYDEHWTQAIELDDSLFPERPDDVETPGQRECPVQPVSVLAAGAAMRKRPLEENPLSISDGIRQAKNLKDMKLTQHATNILWGKPVTIVGDAGETRFITVDFAMPVHGYPFLELADAPEGCWIDWGYGEIPYSQHTGDTHVSVRGWLNPEGVVGKGYGDRYVTRAGRQHVELTDERTARWMTLHLHFRQSGSITIERLGIVKSQYPINPVGSFECGNERVQQIVRLCMIHAEVTMCDTYVDTPGREDGQWIEDARPRAVLASRWFGDDLLRKFMIRTLAQGQFPDGHLHPFAPSNYPAGPATFDWSVQWVGCLYDDYYWTGQTGLIRRYWKQLLKYWENVLKLVNKEGLWQTDNVFADIRTGVFPSKETQSSGIVSPWIMRCLLFSVEMAQAINETQKAEEWFEVAQRFHKAFMKYHIVPEKAGVPAHVASVYDPDDPDMDRGYSQAGQTKALFCDLMPRDEALRNLEYAFPEPDCSPPRGVERWNNPTNFYRVLKVLSMYGMTERAVAHLIERFEPFLPVHPRNPVPREIQGPYGGPLPEYWILRQDLGLKRGQINRSQPPDDTGSHGWGATPLLWMHEWLLGVRVAKPGGDIITISPDDGGLPYVAGKTITPKGPVLVYWDPQQWLLDVKIPPGIEAHVTMPRQCRDKRIEIIEASGAVQLRESGDYQIKDAGRYVFQAR